MAPVESPTTVVVNPGLGKIPKYRTYTGTSMSQQDGINNYFDSQHFTGAPYITNTYSLTSALSMKP